MAFAARCGILCAGCSRSVQEHLMASRDCPNTTGMNFSSLDTYTLRARAVPAIVAAAPAFALVAVSISWDRFALSQIFVSLGLVVLLGVLGDLARRLGRRAEAAIESELGGRPTALRFRDTILDAAYKRRCLEFLAEEIGETAPSEADEKADPQKADAFYKRASNWLRENTRDQSKFHLLFAENVTYGFRRNMYGLKTVALIMNGWAVAVAIAVLVMSPSLAWDREFGAKYLSVIIVGVAHAGYFILVVTKQSVIDASNQYARQLALSCEVLMSERDAQRR